MKRIITYLFFVCCSINTSTAQDVHFSQFHQTPQLLNPATAGFFEGYERLILNHKTQWSALGSPYRTTAASFDLPFYFGSGQDAYLGAGLNFYNDRAGDSKFGINQASLSFSGILPLDRVNKFSAGLQIGFAQRSADLSNLVWGNQFNGVDGFNTNIASNEANTATSFVYADVAAGVFYEFNNSSEHMSGYDITKIQVGASYFHANKPRLKYATSPDETLYGKLVIHSHMRFDIPGSEVAVVPQAIYLLQGPYQELNAGLSLRVKLRNGTKYTGLVSENAISFGFNFRNQDAIIPMFLLELSNYAVGLSFDLTTSAIKNVSPAAGGFEISFRYTNLKDALWKRKVKGRHN